MTKTHTSGKRPSASINIVVYMILPSRRREYNCTVIILVKSTLPIVAEPLDPLNDMLDTYHYDDAESTQAIESTVRGVYNGSEIEVQDQAISIMLEASGCDVDLLLALARSFTAAQDAGHNHCLSTISSIPEEDRLGRITAIRNGPTFSTIVARENLERGPPNVKSSSPANKRVRTNPEVYGCPGKGGKCTKNKFTLWRSRVSYLKHFVQDHVEEYKVGGLLQCPQCEGTESAHHKYPVQGQSLASHIWEKHLSVQTEPGTEITALQSEGEDEMA
ncbi:hypothetical protein GGP41_003921 [Bipolaris sorokiniana]|uniref:Uncharacterized protein n=1 Tax=Cochliobolus sativus TaxID=45130 RepID=A0A8H6DWK5_COCSA|nr:hypothetical protein GGP41_003921 [Bipolaris sorokiniana]